MRCNIAKRIQHRCPQLSRPFRSPPNLYIHNPSHSPRSSRSRSIRPTLLKRHLQRPRKAIEPLRNLIRTNIQHSLPRLLRLVRHLPLHVPVGAFVRRQKRSVERFQSFPPHGHALRSGEEIEGEFLVAVHVEEGVASDAIHAAEEVVYLGRSFEGGGFVRGILVVVVVDVVVCRGCRGGTPFAVEILTGGIRPQIPPAGSVGIDVGHDAKGVQFSRLFGDRVPCTVQSEKSV
mmetsp:Transcript_5097/g.9263  ORF Transcript_5097/g.9263 Transcript_5097/m.9263 type:complete len:232 (-) Transcript_5097:903-1598(-)